MKDRQPKSIESVQQLLDEHLFVLATGSGAMIAAYASGYGPGVHSVNADALHREPITQTPEEATDHKVLAVLLHGQEIKGKPQFANLPNKPLAVLGADVITKKGTTNALGDIIWKELYKASRDLNEDNPEHIAFLREEAREFEEAFWVNWQIALTLATEQGLERTVVASFLGHFPAGIQAQEIDAEFANDPSGVFNRGPRLDLTGHAAKQRIPVDMMPADVEPQAGAEGVEISLEFLHRMVVDRYLPPQALLAVLQQPKRRVDALEFMDAMNSSSDVIENRV